MKTLSNSKWNFKLEKLFGNALLMCCVVMGKQEGKRPLGRPRRRLGDNIKMGLREIGWSDMDWIHLPRDRDQWRALVNTVMNLRVP
jgi:hypothetical protein